MELVFGIVLLVLAVALVVAVSLQSGKDKSLSGTIAGGMDNGFGRGSEAERNRKLGLATTVVSIVFVVIVVVMYIVVS